MELRDALMQIAEIRRTMERAEVFRGYRAGPVAFSGLLAFGAAAVQPLVAPEPTRQVGAYLALWIAAATLSAVAAGAGMVVAGAAASPWRRRITWLAVEQFVPCLVAGGLVTAVLVRAEPEALGWLPGLWQVLFSLGVFASCRLLPRATFAVAVFYLATGVTTLAAARGDSALAPWAMGLPFGFGQLLAAGILYWTLERSDAEAVA
jgi:hypothetical protein